MPIPLIIGGIALVSGLFGAKKGYDAKNNYAQAKNVIADALSEFETCKDVLNEQKKLTTRTLKHLGKTRLKIEGHLMKRFVTAVKQINQVSYRPIMLGGTQVDISAPTFNEMEVASYQAADLLKDGIGAVSSGVLTGIGAGGLATQIGVASTGTAIGSLSGVAATNATLAWLGGGSLATGGMGMAGGAAVLGGAIAGPVIAVMGFSAAKKSEKALSDAFVKEAEIMEAAEQVQNGTAVLIEISTRSEEIRTVIEAVSIKFEVILVQAEQLLLEKKNSLVALQEAAERRHVEYANLNMFVKVWNWLCRKKPNFIFPDPFDFNNFSESEKAVYTLLTGFGYSLYAMLKVKVLDDEGCVTVESETVVADGQNILRSA